MNRREIEEDPWARAEYDKAWNEYERGERSKPVSAEDAQRAADEYFDYLFLVRKRDPDYAPQCELEREEQPRSLGTWSLEADVKAFVANCNRHEHEFIELQLANPELRRLYVVRRQAQAGHAFFSRERQ